MPSVGKCGWAPDYGLPIHKATDCKVGTHIWVTIGRDPEPGDLCKCGLNVWPEPNTGTEPK